MHGGLSLKIWWQALMSRTTATILVRLSRILRTDSRSLQLTLVACDYPATRAQITSRLHTESITGLTLLPRSKQTIARAHLGQFHYVPVPNTEAYRT
ncbi:hypothetical protein BC939DRAFT_464900 [Gamsiella multidivaricata]|uniref:uncharacterized protein n=1 Tax=Gamsiella multidivaricata TaxID=101098 RepID=UPI0022209E2E|nr:uncharacterized protein BC939DRAFT_464900 [Gamsiella multidivaricata]KAI7817752.1 hypothetical protein BC939DRAFT_464900 [Gamsiella multidivaricata]